VVCVTKIHYIKNSPNFLYVPDSQRLANYGLETQAIKTKEQEQKAVSEGDASFRSKNLRNWKQIKQTAKGARRQTDGE
jgi:hypothetical protein